MRLRVLDSQNPADLAAVQLVLDEAPRYARNVSGEAPSPHAARETFEARPEGLAPERKILLGIETDGEGLVGCIDVLRGYPTPETALLGLLLIRQDRQGEGLGKQAFAAFERFVRAWPEIERVRIGVVETNVVVLPFWEARGFRETGLRRPYVNGALSSSVLVLERPLAH